MTRTSVTDFAQDRDWTPPPTNKIALDVTLGAGDSVSLSLIYGARVHYPDGYEQNLGPYFSETSRKQQVSRAIGKGAKVLGLYTGKVAWKKEST